MLKRLHGLNQETKKRYAFLVVALFITAFGIALITNSMLGTSPIACLPFVLTSIFGLTLGTFTFVMNIFLLAAQKLLLGSVFATRHMLQLPTAFLFGIFIDLSMFLTRVCITDVYPLQIVCCTVGTAILGLGISLQVACNSTTIPCIGILVAVSYRWHINFGNVKVLLDLTLVALAALLSWAVLGEIVGIREGTVISAALTGFFAKGFSRITVPLLEMWFTHNATPPKDAQVLISR